MLLAASRCHLIQMLRSALTCTNGCSCWSPDEEISPKLFLTIDVRVVHVAAHHLTYPRNRAGERRCAGLGRGGDVRLRVAQFLANLWQGALHGRLCNRHFGGRWRAPKRAWAWRGGLGWSGSRCRCRPCRVRPSVRHRGGSAAAATATVSGVAGAKPRYATVDLAWPPPGT
jgi:hypothetical protein